MSSRPDTTHQDTPTLVFVVPYRDRELQLGFFRSHMAKVLEDEPSYEIFFVHQQDKRTFNRGAMKNIGFLAMKERYPKTYGDITFVFNDIDTMPYVKNFLPYATTEGVIKHFYGFSFCLGGMVSITGKDFEKTKGFPNFWSWGYEDNALQQRANAANIRVDRSHFYPIMDARIIHLNDGPKRIVNEIERKRYDWKTSEGFSDITHLQYTIEEDMIQVTGFQTPHPENVHKQREHDIRSKQNPFAKQKSFMRMQLR